MRLRSTLIVIAILVLGVTGCALGYVWFHSGAAAVSYRTSELKRGDVTSTISATGTVEPQVTIDVGAQVAGLIVSFGNDTAGKPIDYGSHVTKDMVLARIDPTLYQADYASSQAALQQSTAGVTLAIANLAQMNAKLDQAQSDWDRAQKLGPSDALSQSDYNNYKAVWETGKANVEVGKAQIAEAQANLAASEANLKRSKQNLDYCTITAPVDGIVIDRRVNVGQTVVSSLNAPSLFLLAKDLREIQVWVAVNEADIGNIHAGQPVSFTVDSFPGRTFHGKVNKVRLNATMTQNVVTYTVEVDTENADSALLPYLSANVDFEVAHQDDTLLAPNAALRFTPDTAQIAPDVRDTWDAQNNHHADHGADHGSAADSRPSGTTRPSTEPAPHQRHGLRSGKTGRGTLWVVDGKFLRPIAVRLGPSDGVSTAVTGDGLQENMAVVEGQIKTEASSGGAAKSPFAPQMPQRRPGGGPPR